MGSGEVRVLRLLRVVWNICAAEAEGRAKSDDEVASCCWMYGILRYIDTLYRRQWLAALIYLFINT